MTLKKPTPKYVRERRIEHLLAITEKVALSSTKITEMMCLSPYRVRNYIKDLRRAEPKLLYVEKWVKLPGMTHGHIAFYRSGGLPDADQPAPQPKVVKGAKPRPSKYKKRAPLPPIDDDPDSDNAELRLHALDKKKALQREQSYPKQQHELLSAFFGLKCK